MDAAVGSDRLPDFEDLPNLTYLSYILRRFIGKNHISNSAGSLCVNDVLESAPCHPLASLIDPWQTMFIMICLFQKVSREC